MVVRIGEYMATLFRTTDLQVTDDWIRAVPGTFAIGDVRSAWSARRRVGRGSRLLTAALGLGVLLVLLGGVGATGWFARNWMWVLAAPLIFFGAAFIGLLDPVAIYLEKRHHELWIATDTGAVRVWKHNSVEVHKALRAIQRAVERHQESLET
jgi:hypothetical protein